MKKKMRYSIGLGILLTVFIFIYHTCISDIIVVKELSPESGELTSFIEYVNDYKLPLRNNEFDRIKIAVDLLEKAQSFLDHPIAGDAYFLSGLFFGQVSEWETAISVFDKAIEMNIFDVNQILSTFLWKIQWCKNFNEEKSIEYYDDLWSYLNNNKSFLEVFSKEKNRDNSPYFDTSYTIIISSVDENLETLLRLEKMDKALETVDHFIKWFDKIHDKKTQFEIDKRLETTSIIKWIKPIINQCEYRDIDYFVLKKSIESNLGHWSLSEEDKLNMFSILVTKNPNVDTDDKILALQELVDKSPKSITRERNKYLLANLARKSNKYNIALPIWKTLCEAKGVDRLNNIDIIGQSLIELSYYYLCNNNADEAQKYLNIIENEFRYTEVYQTALKTGLFKWPNEIRSNQLQ